MLFDLDGTISDNSVGIVTGVLRALEALGHDHVGPVDPLSLIGPPLRTMFPALGVPEHRVEEAVGAYRDYYEVTGWAENVLYDGLEDLLRTLTAAGRTLATATSKPQPFAGKILDHFGIADLFTHVGAATLDGTRDHKVDVVVHTIETLGVSADACVMVGDRSHDIDGARAAGVHHTIGVTWGFGDRAELVAAGADLVVDTVDQLANALSISSNGREN